MPTERKPEDRLRGAGILIFTGGFFAGLAWAWESPIWMVPALVIGATGAYGLHETWRSGRG